MFCAKKWRACMCLSLSLSLSSLFIKQFKNQMSTPPPSPSFSSTLSDPMSPLSVLTESDTEDEHDPSVEPTSPLPVQVTSAPSGNPHATFRLQLMLGHACMRCATYQVRSNGYCDLCNSIRTADFSRGVIDDRTV